MIKTSHTQAKALIRQDRRNGRTTSLTLIALLSFFSITFAQSEKTPVLPTPALSELSTLKAENFKLKTQLAQCRVDLLDNQSKVLSTTLTTEQSSLEKEFRKELKCSETDKFNWNTLKCEAPVVKKNSP
jgi:hypothetical protein